MPFGISVAASLGKSVLGGLFGTRSTYHFSPGHPPGAFRGAAALADYNAKMKALGLAGKSTRPQIAATSPGILDTISSALITSMKPGLISATSPIMPGGAVVAGSAGGAINTGKRKKRKTRRVKRRTRARARGGRRRGRRGLSRAQIRAGFGGRRRKRAAR